VEGPHVSEEPRVLIYCDDPSHRKRVNVLSSGNLDAEYPGTGRQWNAANHHPMRGDVPVDQYVESRPELVAAERLIEELVAAGRFEEITQAVDEKLLIELTTSGHADSRMRRQLRCRKCKQRPITVTAEKLAVALNLVRAAGESEVSMTALRAILSEQTRIRSGRPEAELW
jgi:hypothetical protein